MRQVLFYVGFWLTLASVSVSAQALTKGKVGFDGAIVDIPCNIATEDLSQQIYYGELNVAHVTSLTKKMDVQLLNCKLGTMAKPGYFAHKASITFYGVRDSDRPRLLGVNGDAKGVAVRLLDGSRREIILGDVHNDYVLVAPDQTLRFFSEIKINPDQYRAGTFTVILQFLIFYF